MTGDIKRKQRQRGRLGPSISVMRKGEPESLGPEYTSDRFEQTRESQGMKKAQRRGMESSRRVAVGLKIGFS